MKASFRSSLYVFDSLNFDSCCKISKFKKTLDKQGLALSITNNK